MNVLATGACVRVVLGDGRSRVLLWIGLFQFALATVHIAATFKYILDGFTTSATMQDVEAYFTQLARPVSIVQNMTYLLNSLIADGILIWRLYVIWDRSRRIVVPFILMTCGQAVCGFTSIAIYIKLINPMLFFDTVAYLHWVLGSLSFSIATQVLATGLIAWKLSYKMYIIPDTLPASMYWSIIWIIIESGAILSIATIFLLAFFASGKVAGGVLLNILAQLGCLVPASIIFRVSLNKAVEPSAISFPTIQVSSQGSATEETHGSSRPIMFGYTGQVTSTGSNVFDLSSQKV